MTENEAIKAIENDLEWHSKELQPKYKEVLRFTIQALEEIQQYRAIGTVEQLEWCKDASHWKELFKEKLEKYEAIGTVEDIQEVMALCKSLQETTCKYMDIGTIEEFKALKEKNEPKKPRFYAHNYYCTECGNLVGNNEFEWQRFLYCDKCGQKLDWK